MNTIFNSSDYQSIVKRIESVSPNAQRQWGKMETPQMLAHVSETVRMALGEIQIKRTFMGRILGPLMKSGHVGPKPFGQNYPTAPEFLISDKRELENEKQKLLALVKRLHEGGEANVTKAPHGFFGKMTPAQWGIAQWKHLDHHLRQFNA
jgi:Protein of unknown function (DUF1569)